MQAGASRVRWVRFVTTSSTSDRLRAFWSLLEPSGAIVRRVRAALPRQRRMKFTPPPPVSGRFRTGFGPVSGRFRTGFGPVSGRFRTGFGPVSDRFRAGFGPSGAVISHVQAGCEPGAEIARFRMKTRDSRPTAGAQTCCKGNHRCCWGQSRMP